MTDTQAPDDLASRLRCCAGISPPSETTQLRPEARLMMNEAATALSAKDAQIKALVEALDACNCTALIAHALGDGDISEEARPAFEIALDLSNAALASVSSDAKKPATEKTGRAMLIGCYGVRQLDRVRG